MPASYVSARFSALDNSGKPAVGFKLYTYANLTTTPKPTYQDAAGATLNTNPIVLDGRGEAVIFLDEAQVYTFVLKTSTGAVIWSQDTVKATGGGSSGGSGLQIFANAPLADQGPIYITSEGPAEWDGTEYASLYSTGYSGGSWGFKNKMCNSGFTIAQRGTSFVRATPTTGIYTLDNLVLAVGSNAKFTVTQGQDLPNTQQGALGVNYASAVSNAAVAPIATDKNYLRMGVEGYDAAIFGLGSAVVKTMQVSFRALASAAGTYYAAISNGAGTRSYVFPITINAVSTWQKIIVPIPIDTLNGTDWAKDSGAGLFLLLDLGSGTNFETASPNTWQSGQFLRASGGVRLCATNNSELRVTQVQIEEGVQATPYESRPIDAELAWCRRYYERITFNRVFLAAQVQTDQIAFRMHPKRVTPASTVVGAGTLTNCSVTLTVVDVQNALINVNSLAAGAVTMNNRTYDFDAGL